MDITWNDRYAIGHPVIDAEHQTLFRLAREFMDAPDQKTLQNVAMKLYRHTREHFANEEGLMRAIHYPDYRTHAEQHNRMISRLNEISSHIGKSENHRQALESWVNDWVVQHIAQDDVQLLAYLEVSRDGKDTPHSR